MASAAYPISKQTPWTQPQCEILEQGFRKSHKWTIQDENNLRDYCNLNLSWKEVAIKMGRSLNACQKHWKRLQTISEHRKILKKDREKIIHFCQKAHDDKTDDKTSIKWKELSQKLNYSVEKCQEVWDCHKTLSPYHHTKCSGHIWAVEKRKALAEYCLKIINQGKIISWKHIAAELGSTVGVCKKIWNQEQLDPQDLESTTEEEAEEEEIIPSPSSPYLTQEEFDYVPEDMIKKFLSNET